MAIHSAFWISPPNEPQTEFIRLILTSRAARERTLSNPADFAAELFAQHHLGGIKFLRTKDWAARKPEIEKYLEATQYRQTEMGYIHRLYMDPEFTDYTLGQLEGSVSREMDAMLKDMVGQVYSF